MRDHRNYRDTRRNRNPSNATHRPGSRRLEPELSRSSDFSPVRRTQRDDDQRDRYSEVDRSSNMAARDDHRSRYSEMDRSSNISQYSRSVAPARDDHRSGYSEVDRARNVAEYGKSVAAAAARDDQRRRYSEVGRPSNMAMYSEGMAAEAARGGESESASMKFRWNKLLEARNQVENTKNAVSHFSYEKRGYSDSGVVPIVDHRNYSHMDRKNEVEFQIPKNWEQIHEHHYQQQQQHQEQHEHQKHVRCGFSVSQPNASSSSSYFAENVHVHGQMMPKSNSIAEIPKNNSYGGVKQCSVPVINREFNYSEMQGGMMPHDHEFHYRNIMPKGDFTDLEFRRPSIVDSIVDRIDGVSNSHGDTLSKGVTWEQSLSSQQHLSPKYHELTLKYRDLSPNYHDLTPKYHDFTRSHSSCLGCGNMHPEYADTSNCQDCCYKEFPVLNHDQYLYKQEEGNGTKTEELAMHDLDVDMYESRCNGITKENQVWTDFNARQCASDSFDDEDISFDKDVMDVVQFNQFDQRPASPYSSLPANKRNSRKHKMIIGKSMKNSRAGRIITFPNYLVSSCRNVHARLGPRVVPSENPYAGKNIKRKKLERNLLDVSKTATCSDLSDFKVNDLSDVKVKVKHSKTGPPEGSKEFNQLVDNAFFKFVKLLNENPAQRRKYTRQGGTDTLRCTLCGSESKEFPNTQSLAMHAFNSTKAQRRAEHLGFHKALCLLLGWSDTAASDGLWVQKMLPDAEASNLKNDLIMWPPVVLVHNSSIAHHDPDKRVTVSIEGLEAILRGMGFGGGKTKVSRGKPGNFSILVVTFKATFSGLQEAEKLHKIYADNKRGRDELQQIDDDSLKDSNEETQYRPGNEESALYGYLGNAQDLDKLDYESKKHCVVKSKKEIQAIANANLKAD